MRRTRVIFSLLLVAALAVSGSVYYLLREHKEAAPELSASKAQDTPVVILEADQPAEPAASPPIRKPASVDAEIPSAEECAPVEFAGRGPEKAIVSAQEWERLMTTFHGLKADYEAWLRRRSGALEQKALQAMLDEMKLLRIQRPPTPEEPDLTWRGISIRSFDENGEPLVRIGDGFLALFRKQPARAKFELARVMAQAWAPCELEKRKLDQPWGDLMNCLGLDPAAKGCAAGGFSDAGWAISTALALQVAKPGCRVPAFNLASAQACLWQQMVGKKQWKEARR